jgi:hypothetical protein
VTARTQPRTVADLIGDLPPHNYRIGYLIGDLAALSTFSLACKDFYTLEDAARCGSCDVRFVEDCLDRFLIGDRFTNNLRDADLLRLAVLDPSAMTAADRQAVEPFAPFLAFAAPVIIEADGLESALERILFPREAADEGDPLRRLGEHIEMCGFRDALARTVAALATLIGDLAAGRVTLPPFDPRIIAEREALIEPHRFAVIEAGGALGNRSQAFAPSARALAADPGDAELFPWAASEPASSASPSPLAASDPDEAFELAEARVIAADAALVEARAAVTSALLKIPGRLIADFVAVVADTEAARRAACAAERQRDVTEGEADELGPDAFAEALGAAADKLSSAHLALLNFSLRETRFVADALSSLE